MSVEEQLLLHSVCSETEFEIRIHDPQRPEGHVLEVKCSRLLEYAVPGKPLSWPDSG